MFTDNIHAVILFHDSFLIVISCDNPAQNGFITHFGGLDVEQYFIMMFLVLHTMLRLSSLVKSELQNHCHIYFITVTYVTLHITTGGFHERVFSFTGIFIRYIGCLSNFGLG